MPVDALPGTPEKVAVLEKRAAHGEQLFHPADGRRSLLGLPGEWPQPDAVVEEDDE